MTHPAVILRVRSTLEFACPVFHSSLSKEQSHKIEMIRKKAFAIILGQNYQTYENALNILCQERLDTRRKHICLNFALKCTKSNLHYKMLRINANFRENMRYVKKFLEPKCRTSRPIPYMTRLLNKNQEKK